VSWSFDGKPNHQEDGHMTNRFWFGGCGVLRANRLKAVGATMAVAFSTAAWAQTTPPRVVFERSAQHSLASKATGRTYEVMVSLPRDYDTSGKTYPVLYALDGWHFPLLAFLQNNSTSSTRRLPPVIMVVIGHGHPPNLNEVRSGLPRPDFPA
jgi:enterochelin esterase-like enzyme